jgi:hypothetical protein
MKERQRHTLSQPVHIEPGDTLKVSIHDKGTRHSFTELVGRHATVDTIVTFDVDEPILGLRDGIGAIFGEAVR